MWSCKHKAENSWCCAMSMVCISSYLTDLKSDLVSVKCQCSLKAYYTFRKSTMIQKVKQAKQAAASAGLAEVNRSRSLRALPSSLTSLT